MSQNINPETLICRECPTPIQWEQLRRHYVARINDELKTLRERLAQAESKAKGFDTIIEAVQSIANTKSSETDSAVVTTLLDWIDRAKRAEADRNTLGAELREHLGGHGTVSAKAWRALSRCKGVADGKSE